MNWCDHWNYLGGGEWEFWRSGYYLPGATKDPGKYCLECGAKRPARKGLVEKFLTAIAEHRAFGIGGCTIEDECQREKLAKTAIDHAFEVIDEWSKNYASDMNDSLTLKKMLRESI